ncbi:uncharacterized protein LACBIDRAFT_325297 [Laccaria bicolor S238N-H82]|uniref:Predicted protein n=1 Tax=Laccaria bicolor (strain S238N-H82 / ATCC MYA-4686) TaxID=486041 RepID=B0D4G5_LACBS|nr:uncharacterized protein LACBIDRAFT_325297 [Laccaria bicolor S238N-H82]EDR10558.1 predicted protein [Laccaria bicolor S238N-H82]|eukprot:XP_001879008.1 predicted protein [Laccaria bicolor S238N-H82]
MAESGGGCRTLARGGGGGGGRERDGHADVTMPQKANVTVWQRLNTTVHWTGTGLRKVACSPVRVQWTGLDWTGLDLSPVDWALCKPIWPSNWATGIHWTPLDSTGIHMDYVGDGKDLQY